MAPNIREIWNRRSGRMVHGSSRGSLPRFSQLSRTVHRRMNDAEAHPRHHRRPGLKACAQACAKAGVPLGLLSSDGTMYLPVSSKPGDPQNSKLAPFAESKVKVTGTHRLVSGLHTIEIKTVSAAT